MTTKPLTPIVNLGERFFDCAAGSELKNRHTCKRIIVPRMRHSLNTLPITNLSERFYIFN